ncbi:MAG: RluA family pseudouridine synthase [Thermodesulfobacteriota bacterium]
MLEHLIGSEFHNVRLDKFIRKQYPLLPKSGLFKLIRKGRIKVNNKKQTQNYRLLEGDVVRIWAIMPENKSPSLVQLNSSQKEMIRRAIVYQDKELLIFNKPAGLVMYRGSGHDYGLNEMVAAYLENKDFTFVNRIDKPTSGLVLGAKNLVVTRKLSELIRTREVEKYYAVVVDGEVQRDRFSLESHLKKGEKKVSEAASDEKGSRLAIADFTVERRGHGRTLLTARLHTGRTHQLRVQLAQAGHPIVGDHKYGRGGGGEMLLFSRRLVVEAYGIDIELDLPKAFLAALTP